MSKYIMYKRCDTVPSILGNFKKIKILEDQRHKGLCIPFFGVLALF